MAQQDPNQGFSGGLLGPWLAAAMARGSQSQFAPMPLSDQSGPDQPMPAAGSLAQLNPFARKAAAAPPQADTVASPGLFSGVQAPMNLGGQPGMGDPDDLAGLW